MNPDYDVKRIGFYFFSDFNAFSNDGNGVGVPNDKIGLSPDNDEVTALELIPPPNGTGAFNDIVR